MFVWMLLGAGTSSTALASVNPELLINRFTFIDNAACVTTAAHSESVAAPETVSANFVREFQFYPLPHSHNPLTNHTLRSSKSLLASRARSAAICSDKKFRKIHPNSSKFIQIWCSGFSLNNTINFNKKEDRSEDFKGSLRHLASSHCQNAMGTPSSWSAKSAAHKVWATLPWSANCRTPGWDTLGHWARRTGRVFIAPKEEPSDLLGRHWNTYGNSQNMTSSSNFCDV